MTFVLFVSTIAALAVTGVRRRLPAPPVEINAGDLPLMYPRLPTQENTWATFTETNHSATVELCIVLSPQGLGYKPTTFADACALVDILNPLLAAETVVDSWTIRMASEVYADGGPAYTVLIATIEGSW